MKTEIWTNDHPRYPAGMALVELVGGPWARPAPPLYIRGPLPNAPGVAIIGPRSATPTAERFARELGRAAAEEGWSVWSGGARGVDRAAHEGALEAGGVTVVVAGGGLDRPYPRANVDLFRRVLDEGGAMLSLWPDDTPPYRWTFLCRNVVLVALSRATVVCQARRPPSGTMKAAAAARRMGRPVLAVPGSPWDDEAAGSAFLLTRGADPVVSVTHAMARLRHHLSDVPTLAPRSAPPAPRMTLQQPPSQGGSSPTERPPSRTPRTSPPPTSAPGRSDDADELAPHLSLEPQTVDELCDRARMSAARVQRALLILTLRGEVVDVGGRYRRP